MVYDKFGGMKVSESLNNMFSGNEQTPLPVNHGAHGILDTHEVLNGMIGAMDQYVFLRDKIQDPQLRNIADRQFAFMKDEYNLTVQAYKTGRDPEHRTQPYMMQTDNNFQFGLSQSQPKKPITNASEINDGFISGVMLGIHKAGAAGKTAAALECASPVLRRVLQASIPNCVEMAYELSLYQNKMGYYEAPQLSPEDTSLMLRRYEETGNMPN